MYSRPTLYALDLLVRQVRSFGESEVERVRRAGRIIIWHGAVDGGSKYKGAEGKNGSG